MDVGDADPSYSDGVSVLFSEPKIPQLTTSSSSSMRNSSFSALQRAENSSILTVVDVARTDDCFSALQRAENSSIRRAADALRREQRSFSALQRAENSSIEARGFGRFVD